ncbi:MAG: hypothetical protein ABEK29_03365, partial [Bradymonadaceae bacterium]
MQKVEPGPRERIAEHWVEAGELDRAVELLLDECKLLQERNADEEIRRILERRTELLRELDVPDDDPRWAQQKLQRAHVFEDRGHLERARGMLEDLWQQLDDERRRLRGKVAENLTGVEVGLGRTDPARMWCSRALEICKHIDDPELETSCRQRVGWLLVFDGDFDAAERQADRAIETAQQCGHRYLELEGLRLRATIWKHRGVSGTEALYDRIRREASADGYVAIEAEASNGLGQQALFDGRLEQARAYFVDYIRKARELSRPESEGIGKLNLANAELCAGHFEEGKRQLREAEALFEAIGAEGRWEPLRRLLRLVHATGVGDRSRADSLWEPMADGWPDSWPEGKEHPWLIERT